IRPNDPLDPFRDLLEKIARRRRRPPYERVLAQHALAGDRNHAQIIAGAYLRLDIERRQKAHTHAELHHLPQRVEARALVVAANRRAETVAEPLNLGMEGMRFFDREHLFAGQIELVDSRPLREAMLARDDELQRLLAQDR